MKMLFQLAITFVASVCLAIAIPAAQRDRGNNRMANPAPDPTLPCHPIIGCRASDNNRMANPAPDPTLPCHPILGCRTSDNNRMANPEPDPTLPCHPILGCRASDNNRMANPAPDATPGCNPRVGCRKEAVRQAEETAAEKTNAEEVATVFAKIPCYEPATNCMRCMMFDRVNRCCKFWAPILGRRRRHQICTQKKRKQKRSTTEESAVDKTGEKSGNLRSHILASDAVKQEEKMAMDKTEAKSKNLRL